MKPILKSLKTTHPTPLVSLFAVITTVLAGVFVYQKFFGSPVIDFGPIMTWVAIAIPVGIFGSVFLQVRASQRNQQVAQQVHARINELQANPRLSENPPRHSGTPRLDRPLPDKDPFENL